MRPASVIMAAAFAMTLASGSVRAQTAGCVAVTTEAASAAQDEITSLRNNIRKPASVTGLTCLNALTSISTLSGDVIVQSFVDNILTQIVSKVCAALNDYWQTVLNQMKCGITISGVGMGFGLGGIGGGSVCQFNFNLGGGYGTIGAGIGPDGGGFYINGVTNNVQPFGQ